MALVKLVLDTRKSSQKKDGTFPISLRAFHKKARFVKTGYYTSILGWDEGNTCLRKSAVVNKKIDCFEINSNLEDKLYQAKQVIRELGKSVELIKVDMLTDLIKDKWDFNPNSELKQKAENQITLSEWGAVIINRKRAANRPGTALWYEGCIKAIKKYNGGKDIMLIDITVTFLKNFEAHHLGKGNSRSTIGIYLKAVRAIYNSAINEDQFEPIKHSFKHYRIPSSTRTKKRAVAKKKILNIKELEYPFGSTLWQTKNYALVMFYCRGMNFVDLVKIKVKDIVDGRLYYGRSKTGNPFSVKITKELEDILAYYLKDKKSYEFVFPTNYDGSTEHFEKFKSQRRRMNERLKIIATDAGIEGSFTTYSIRHSWATIAKYMGISTALISEGLGHSSIKTTEIYLKDFENVVLDEVNFMVTQ